MHDLFFEINRRHGTTIVVVTHNLGFAEAMPRVVTMQDGKISSDDKRGKSASDAAGDAPPPREAEAGAPVAP
jgi:lipoprotein-releasing system ATP-binding protein